MRLLGKYSLALGAPGLARTECAVDAIRNGTFFHFWSGVVADTSAADDLPCPH